MLSQKNITKIIRNIQNPNSLQLLKQLKQTNPDFHWYVLKDQQTGDTLLHQAANYGSIEILQYLLNKYVPQLIDCTNNDSKTALHVACQAQQLECVECLLVNGANVNALKRADWTPLMLACTKDSYGIVEILLKYQPLMNWCNKDGWTCLHLACRNGCVKIVKFLLENGADYHQRTNNGRNIYHIIALHGHKQLLIELFELNLDLDIDAMDSCGNTPLHESVLSGNYEIYQLIKQKSHNLRIVNKAGFNLLHLACSEGYNEIIYDLVINEGFDINELMVNTPGVRPVHCAYRKHKFDTLKYLEELGANLSANDLFNRNLDDYSCK